jgi:hypothetical protein
MAHGFIVLWKAKLHHLEKGIPYYTILVSYSHAKCLLFSNAIGTLPCPCLLVFESIDLVLGYIYIYVLCPSIHYTCDIFFIH